MTVSRREFLIASGGVGLSAALLAACGNGATGGGVQMWGKFSNAQNQKYFQDKFVDAYNKSTTVKVSLQGKPPSAYDQIVQTALAAGHAPDIVDTGSPGQVVGYTTARYLQPLDGVARRNDWPSKLLAWAYSATTIDGRLYAIPNAYETLLTFYNPATLHQHDLSVPSNREEFEAFCTEAKGQGMIPVGAGNGSDPGVTQWFVTIFLNNYAGPEAVYRALTGEIKFSDPVFVDAITLLNGYFQQGWYGGSVEDYFTNTFETLYQKLAAGEIALEQTGSWSFAESAPYFGSQAGNDATWDWAPLPTYSDSLPTSPYTLSVGGSYGIPKTSARADDAAAFLNWMVESPRVWFAGVKDIGMEPMPVPITSADFAAGTDSRVKRLYTDLAGAELVGYTTWTFLGPQTDTFAYTGMNKVIIGKMKPSEYCAQLASVFQSEREAGKIPPTPKPS